MIFIALFYALVLTGLGLILYTIKPVIREDSDLD